MGTAILSKLAEFMTEIGTIFTNMFTSGISIFYDSAGSEGSELTAIGEIALIGLGVSLFLFAFGFIRRLIRMRG